MRLEDYTTIYTVLNLVWDMDEISDDEYHQALEAIEEQVEIPDFLSLDRSFTYNFIWRKVAKHNSRLMAYHQAQQSYDVAAVQDVGKEGDDYIFLVAVRP